MRSRVRHAIPDEDAEIDAHRASASTMRRVAELAFIALLRRCPARGRSDGRQPRLGLEPDRRARGRSCPVARPRPRRHRWPCRSLRRAAAFDRCLFSVFWSLSRPVSSSFSPLVPASWRADLYARAALVLGHPIEAIISINADASRDALMKIAACGAIFVMARATCRDRRRARLFLIFFLASAVLVTAYGLLMQASNGSCYVFNYSKRSDIAPPGRQYICALSLLGTELPAPVITPRALALELHQRRRRLRHDAAAEEHRRPVAAAVVPPRAGPRPGRDYRLRRAARRRPPTSGSRSDRSSIPTTRRSCIRTTWPAAIADYCRQTGQPAAGGAAGVRARDPREPGVQVPRRCSSRSRS